MVRLLWKTQYASYNNMTDIVHFASCRFGMFEIFDDGSNYLLHYPRDMRRASDLFKDLKSAKKAASMCA